MLILGIDTTTKTASTAVMRFDYENFEKPTVLSDLQSDGKISHSEMLMPMIDSVLKSAGICLNDIDLFAVAHGPGSFTGIRIGIATVKGLAFGTANSCIGISSLYALAYNFYAYEKEKAKNNLLILPVIDARRKQVYNAVFHHFDNFGNVKYIKNDRIITVGELEAELNSEFSGGKIIFTGDGADMCYNEIKFAGEKIQVPDVLKIPSAASLCRAAYDEYKNKKRSAINPRILAPSYLIKTQAERELNERSSFCERTNKT